MSDPEHGLDEATKASITDELRKWQFGDVRSAIVHLSYSVPEGKRFTTSDCEHVLDVLDFDTYGIGAAISHLQWKGALLEKRLGKSFIAHYCMERRAREKYREELKPFDRNAEPEKKQVSAQLHQLATLVTEAQEAVFLDETIKCLKVDANRAAIVMAWNLAYHHIRSWILARHLSKFNAELTSRARSKTKNHDPVSSHDDFPESESFVLEVCRAAGFLDKHRFGILEGDLKTRNRYAHPSPAIATGPQATGYVAGLLQHVLLDKYFD